MNTSALEIAKIANRLQGEVETLEKERMDLIRQRDSLTCEVTALADENQALDEENDDLKGCVETLTGLLEEAKEHVPEIAVYGIDHRRIEEATKDAIRVSR